MTKIIPFSLIFVCVLSWGANTLADIEPERRLSGCRLQLTDKKEIAEYFLDFSRNVGIVTPEQQLAIGRLRVAVAGVGGIGGEAVQTLSEMGVGSFVLADPDKFERANKNKQSAANDTTLGQYKTDVTARNIMSRNRQAKIHIYGGITPGNIDEFLEDVDLVVDGIDIFEMSTRRLVFNRALEKGIPVITVGPPGRTVAGIYFKPGGMNFDEYFAVDDSTSEMDLLIHFLVGLAPERMHAGQIITKYFDVKGRIAPAYATATRVAGGHIGEMISGILLNTHKVQPAPWSFQYDITRQVASHTYLPFGNRGPIQRIRLALAKREFKKLMDKK